MSNLHLPEIAPTSKTETRLGYLGLFYTILFFAGVLGFYAFQWLITLPLFTDLFSFLNQILGLNTTRATWFVTRAAGWLSYLLVWLSVVWGLVLPTKFFKRYIAPAFSFDFHEYLSLLAIGFLLLHMFILLADSSMPYNLAQILVPFLSPYRPLWVGLGVISFYLIALVTITFYIRSKIGHKNFKAIHITSFLAYMGATIHAFFAGTDSTLGAAVLIYYFTFLSVVFLTAFWLLSSWQSQLISSSQPKFHGTKSPANDLKSS